MFSIFKPRKKVVANPLATDIHSHLLPLLDDGVKSFEESASLVSQFADLGYSQLITTPHSDSYLYRHEAAAITGRHSELMDYLRQQGIVMPIQAAAEYYLDEALHHKIANDEPLLTFGDRYLLFETNFLSEPLQLKEFIFSAATRGYKPVLAHPERYQYLVDDFDKVEDLKSRGVFFQVNIPSLIGAYSRPVKKLAMTLIDRGWVDFLGSDCHNQRQMDMLKKAWKSRPVEKALALPLLNRTL